MRKNIIQADYRLMLDTLIASNDLKSLAVLLIAYTGARSNEILKITHKQIDLVQGCNIHIIASKRGINRWIPLPEILLARLKDLRGELISFRKPFFLLITPSSEDPITTYRSISRHFNTLQVELFGEQRYTLHSWRHSLATRAFQNNRDVMAVMTMLGHKSLDASARYLTEFKSDRVLSEVYKLVEGTA